MNRVYIHLLEGWTRFFWDHDSVASALVPVRHRQGLLLGRMSSLARGLQTEASLAVLTDDAEQTSAIEREVLEPRSVRLSLARNLRRDRARVDPPELGRERVHFEAPAAARVAPEMTRFLDWFERRDTAVGGPVLKPALDPVLRAGDAHLWCLTIHPFDDGNSRIGRAIEAHKDEYWTEIERAQRASLDITRWLLWFIECLDRALARAEAATARVHAQAAIWTLAERERPLHARQRAVLARMLGEQGDFEGFLNSSKYAKLAKCSTDTALRDINDLLARGVLVRNSAGGRSVSYRLAEMGEA